MTDTQLSLDDIEPPANPALTLARRTDPITAKIAAQRAAIPERLSEGRWLALDTLARRGPLTDHELAELTGRVATSIGRRRGDLVERGWCVATDDRRPSPSGSPSTVWRLTTDGLALWSELAARFEEGDRAS